MILGRNLIERIGNTPLLRLDRFNHWLGDHGSQILGKAEFCNPGGSVKDQESVDCCDKLKLAMVVTGIRHFKH